MIKIPVGRRAFVMGMAAVIAAVIPAVAQPTNRPARIGWLSAGSKAQAESIMAAFEAGLSQRGHVNGKTVSIEYAFIPPVLDQFTQAAASISQRVDILVAWGTIGGAAAKKAGVTCPVVFASVGFPVGIGLVHSLRSPGTNFTGISFEAAENTYAKRLQIVKELVPGATRVAMLGPQDDPNISPALEAAHSAARSLGLKISDFKVRTADELPEAFGRMATENDQAVLIVAGAFAWVHRDRIAALALAGRIPSVHGLREGVDAGGLVSLGPDLVVMGSQAATYVDKILRGAKPADLPVEQPARYELRINMRAARTMNLRIPQSLLVRADQVLE